MITCTLGEKKYTMDFVSGRALREMEPAVSKDAVAALYAPTGGIVCPFTMTYALAENAAANGVEFVFDAEVRSVTRMEGGFRLDTGKGSYEGRLVVNAAGVYSDLLHNQVCEAKLHQNASLQQFYLHLKSNN